MHFKQPTSMGIKKLTIMNLSLYLGILKQKNLNLDRF